MRTVCTQMPNLGTKLYVRVDDSEKEAFARAAAIGGMELSVWVRMALRAAAKADLAQAGEKPTYALRPKRS